MSLPLEPNPTEQPGWLVGQGVGPKVAWRLGTDGALTAFTLARETREVVYADDSPAIYRADGRGRIQCMMRQAKPVRLLDWSDDGSAGAAVFGNENLVRLDRNLQSTFSVDLPDTCTALAMSPYGNHIAVAMSNGLNYIFNERKKRIAEFQTVRPLAFLQFCSTDPVLIAAAEHGLLCCHDLKGAEVWQERMWNNVGDLAITGSGDHIYLAGYSHGIQTHDGGGSPLGSYVLEGTVSHLSVSFEPQRLLASTIEGHLYWVDSDGELLWATSVPEAIVDLQCDAIGEWGLVGFETGGIYRLDW
ncbi:MAG: WD40 repeat domain-containing protein [Planctomycetaceae bacterium]|nr:WD40 repeat domain-containing protein [Planctomycetaceae bacterium]